MAKEKKSYFEQEKKDLTFYYEIIGIISIIIPIIILARLGLVGHYTMIVFRLIFGDWYFMVVIAWFIYGIRCLIYHKPLNIKSMRFIGTIIIFISLLVISHFPMHEYLSQHTTNNNYLSLTFSLYLDYFKNYYEGMIVGGGIIGCLFFYLCYFLFARIGTLIIAIIFIFVGISFLFQKTIGEFTSSIGNVFKIIWNKTIKIFYSLKYDVKKGSPLINLHRTNKVFDAKLLEGIKQEYFPILEEKNAEEHKKIIQGVLNNLNIFYNEINMIISNQLTSYIILTYAFYSLDQINMKLHQILNTKFSLKEDTKNHHITIEIMNLYPRKFDFKSVFLENRYINNYQYPLGLSTKNNLVINDFKLIPSLMYIGEKSKLKDSIASLILMSYFKFVHNQFICYYWDYDGSLCDYKDEENYLDSLNKETLLGLMSELIEKIEIRLEQMNMNNVNTFTEYNRKVNTEYKNNGLSINRFLPYYIYIGGIQNIFHDNEIIEKMICFIQLGTKVGFFFIVTVSADQVIPSILNSLFNDKIILKNDFSITSRILGFDSYQLLNDNEALYQSKNNLIRLSLTMCSRNDLNNTIKQIKKLTK